MKGRFLPLSPEQSLESRQGRDPAMFELLVSSRAAPSHQQVIGGGFCFYCVSDPMMILFSVHKLCPDDPFDEVSACPLVLCVSSPLLGRRRRLYRSTCFGSIEPTSQVLLSSLIYLYRDRPWLFPQVFETLMPFCSGGNWNDVFFFSKYLTKWKTGDRSWDQWTVKHYLWFRGFFPQSTAPGQLWEFNHNPPFLPRLVLEMTTIHWRKIWGFC